MAWLFEAKKRFGTSILNYMVTSNHVHLVIRDHSGKSVIPQTMQLVAGRTGQEYNQRKGRTGAFWEDRYHAVAVETDLHLVRCLIYIDLNMVRAGAVNHPMEWSFSGYREIQNPRQRYKLLDHMSLMELLGIKTMDELGRRYKDFVDEALQTPNYQRQPQWTESIAVGSETFVQDIKEKLGIRAVGRKITGNNETYELREATTPYNAIFRAKMAL